jgi:hypothetical protein
MKPFRSFSLFVAVALFAFAFLFASNAQADSRVIGTLQCKGSVLKNKQTASAGDEVRNGDVIQTGSNQIATVELSRGGKVLIKKMTRVRIFDNQGQPMDFAVVYGSIELQGVDGRRPGDWPAGWAGDGTVPDSEGDVAPLPYLAAFGFGNFTFPSIGGGSATSSTVTSRVLPNGQVIFLNDLGEVLLVNGVTPL